MISINFKLNFNILFLILIQIDYINVFKVYKSNIFIKRIFVIKII